MSLFRIDENCCASAVADRAAFLVDAQAYFDAFARAAERAQRSLLILAWDFDSRASLTVAAEGHPGITIGEFLNRLCDRNKALRIRVLAMLEEQPASPVQLAQRLPDASLGAIAYHVRTLLNLGLLELVGTRQRRGATEHVYRAIAHPRFTDESWDALGPVAKQRLLTAMLQQIGEYTANSAAAGGFDRPDAHITRTPLKLDEKGWTELAEASKEWLREVARIEAAARKRSFRSRSQTIRGLPSSTPISRT